LIFGWGMVKSRADGCKWNGARKKRPREAEATGYSIMDGKLESECSAAAKTKYEDIYKV